jgi:diguanylate cyclase (GGDEF)-like protein
MPAVMSPAQPLHVADHSEIRLRVESLAAGVKLQYAIFGAGVLYVAATWQQPGRPLMASLFVLVGLVGLLIGRISPERLVRSRRREAFFLGWTLFSILVTGMLVAIDGGVGSPLTVLFFVPLIFAALSYPLQSVVVAGAACEFTFVMVAVVYSPPEPVRIAFFAGSLGFAAVLCAWQAMSQDHRRQELALISRTDPLTGSLNRRGFEERLSAQIDEGVRTGRPLSLAMFDLDDFKRINDTHGHAAGDEVLRWTAEQSTAAVRPMDSVGRLGGDEFALLLPGTGYPEAIEVAGRLRTALESRLTAAVGVASFPTHGVDADELLRHADAELYAVKEDRPSPPSPGRRELSWAAALARAADLRMQVTGSSEHSARVAACADGMGRLLGWSDQGLSLLRMAAMLHDVGKVSVPDSILCKAGALSAAEYERVKAHPVTGAELIRRVDGLEPILPWIRHSHEHFDGSGYPDGLSGGAIPQAARILLVADAFDAMTSDRPYRQAITADEALDELRRGAGRQFDAECVEALIAHLAASPALSGIRSAA